MSTNEYAGFESRLPPRTVNAVFLEDLSGCKARSRNDASSQLAQFSSKNGTLDIQTEEKRCWTRRARSLASDCRKV